MDKKLSPTKFLKEFLNGMKKKPVPEEEQDPIPDYRGPAPGTVFTVINTQEEFERAVRKQNGVPEEVVDPKPGNSTVGVPYSGLGHSTPVPGEFAPVSEEFLSKLDQEFKRIQYQYPAITEELDEAVPGDGLYH